MLQREAIESGEERGIKIKATSGEKGIVLVNRDGSMRLLPYGKTLGKGGFAHVRAVVLQDQVLRTAQRKGRSFDNIQGAEEDFLKERQILNKLHGGGDAVGIIKPSVLVSYTGGNENKGGEGRKIGVLQHRYEGDGKTLAEQWSREQRPLMERLQACRPLLQGLSHMHQMNMAAGDIKGGNVLFDDEGLVLADLGGAEEGKSPTVYTPIYSPLKEWIEQQLIIDQKTGFELAKRDDLHALGLTILALLDGKKIDSSYGPRINKRIQAISDPGIRELLSKMIIQDQHNVDDTIRVVNEGTPLYSINDALRQLDQILRQ